MYILCRDSSLLHQSILSKISQMESFIQANKHAQDFPFNFLGIHFYTCINLTEKTVVVLFHSTQVIVVSLLAFSSRKCSNLSQLPPSLFLYCPLWCDQSIGASASPSVLPANIQDWFPLGLIGLISLLSKGLSRVFSNTTIRKHQFFSSQSSLWSNSPIGTWSI